MNPSTLPRTIERLGYRVTADKQGDIRVNLPLFCSVRVSAHSNGQYSMVPYFGLLPRTTGTLVMEVMYGGLGLLAIWASRVAPELMSLMLIVLVTVGGGMMFDAYRYVLTEVAMMRIYDRLPSAEAA